MPVAALFLRGAEQRDENGLSPRFTKNSEEGRRATLFLRKSSEIKRVLAEGSRVPLRFCILVVARSREETSRFAIIASRKVGGAVIRNRMKRLYREAIRLYYDVLEKRFLNKDIIIIVRKNSPQSLSDVLSDLNLGQ